MSADWEIRIGGEARTLEEEEGLQMAVTILKLNKRLRETSPARVPRGPMLPGPKPPR